MAIDGAIAVRRIWFPGDVPLRALQRDLAAPVKADVAAVREAEFDYQLEKLSAEDYRELCRLEAQGLEVIGALDPGVS